MNTTKRDVLELRRRMTRKDCTITRLCGCYVDGNGNVVLKFSRRFSDLPEEEFYKYLEIAKKVLSGSLGGNLLELRFQRTQTAGERQKYLYALKAGKLENPDMLDRLYEQIIEQYRSDGNYLILVFHDLYDVPARSSDRKRLDESSEVYEYMIVAVCPVDFSKPGLSYRESEGRIGVSERFWMVGAPEIGFTYPAFVERSADSDAVLYYVKSGKDSHAEIMEEVLQCGVRRTAGEEKAAFREVIEGAFEDPQQARSVFLKVQKQLGDLTLPDPDRPDETPQVTLTGTLMADVMREVDMPQEAREIIQEAFEDRFGDLPPQAENVVDQKLVEESSQRLRTLELEDQVTDLKETLKTRDQELSEARTAVREAKMAAGAEENEDADILLSLSPLRAKDVHARMLGGVKYLVVPLENGDTTRINGEDFSF